ncbi:hypothetical protein K440DRAFT_646191 [Wilcoxina mikolae CBS 423.85]|nr:hypothetical protein K440DRAFT_646191 [Wilcoxina mikolae CBS 423.85]
MAPKLIKNLGTAMDPDTGCEYPEKIIIFAGVPVVAYIIWLSLRAVVPTPELPDGYDEPIKLVSQECNNNREQVKLMYGPNKGTREDTVARFSDNLFEARVIVGTYACMAESFNLIRPAKVVLFQPDWLVLSEEQAKARVWRCGQASTTLSYRLLTTDSVDMTASTRSQVQSSSTRSTIGNSRGGSEDDDEDYYY